MADFEALLNRWQSAGVLDAEATDRIRAWELEQKRPLGLRWQVMVALILGAILLACGVVLFVSAHWDELGPGLRYTVVIGMVAVFHLAGGFTRKEFRGLSTALHAVGTVSTGAAIALVGQIFNIQEHWPGAVLLWALAALAGWILLRDEAQQTLTLLLFPAWILSEFSFYADGHIGEEVFIGRFLVLWAVLYLTVFLRSKHKIVQGVLFAVAAIAGVVGIALLAAGWISWPAEQSYLPFNTRLWGWTVIAALPLFFSIFRLRRSAAAVMAALVFSIALPWLTPAGSEPSLLSHALVAAFAVFITWWGVRQTSQALVNLGIVGFGLAVGWFYFSNIFSAVGRSLGLIGLGILFLAGGWALEKTRRGLLAGMKPAGAAQKEAR
jgi:MFS family permease